MVEEQEGPKWTEAGLKAIPPTGTRKVFPDPATPGLVLLMTPAGAKTFYLVYRAGGGRSGKKKWYKLGQFKVDIGLETARGMATSLRGKIRDGADPQAERKHNRIVRPGTTVNDLCDRFLRVYVDGGQVAVSTGRTYRQNIEANIKPVIGKMDVREVRAPHITSLLEDILPGQASHVRSTLNRLFTRAELWELRPGLPNPVKGQDRPKANKRTGHRLTPEEFRILGAALKKHRKTKWQLCGLVTALALTGMRVGELVGSTQGKKPQRPWSDIDLKAGIITLPATAHKTGRKAGARTVYLCREGVARLKALPRENELLLGGWRNPQHAWLEFRATIGLEHINLHDFRHTYISNADELVTAATRAVLVGHAAKTMSDHYTHKLNPELVKGAQKVGRAIASMLGL